MKITPIGAAGQVTGSCFLIEANGKRYIVDCGMFQGHDVGEAENGRFPVEPSSIDAAFLTHAHLDHCGRLPFLHARGFRGQVYATASTCDLAQFILLDAAKLQREDHERRFRRGQRAGIEVTPPLYDEQDVIHLMKFFSPVTYEAPFAVDGLQVIYHQSGHILGSASIEIREGGSSVLFSGDLGSPGRNVVPDPATAPECDLVFCESTYGDRLHRGEAESIQELADAINWAYKQGGNVIIPAFALERTQDVLFQLHQLRGQGKVPNNPVFMDSPLAINLTRVYEHHPQDLDDQTRQVLAAHSDPFNFPGLTTVSSSDQSRSLNGRDRIIIIAGSGMCNGGRVVHHLKHNLWRENCAVIFIGYQAEGTLGRRIVDHAPNITIEHEPIAVKARTFTINGFSAHADQAALATWLATTAHAQIVLNHGEPATSAKLAALLTAAGRTVDVAQPGKAYDTEKIVAGVR